MSKEKKEVKESQELVAKTQSGGLAAASEFVDGYDFGGSEMFNFRDLIIPKVLVMQGLSKLVAAGDAKMGDIVDTAANEVVGSVREKDRKPLRFFPLQMFRYWVHRDNTDDGLKFAGATPWTPENADTAWEEYGEGEKLKRVNEETVVFAIVREDLIDNLEEPPRLLSFRKTSLKQTKQLKHHFLMCHSTRKEVPFQTGFELSGRLDANEKKEQWYLPEIFPKGKATHEQCLQLAALYKRYGKMIKDKIAGLLDEDELPASAEGAAMPKDVTPPKVEAEGPRARF